MGLSLLLESQLDLSGAEHPRLSIPSRKGSHGAAAKGNAHNIKAVNVPLG